MQIAGVEVPLTSFRALLPSRDDYRGLKKRLPSELVAGLTVGIVALPLALGFGVASGVGAAAGLVTAVVAGVVAAIFGGSHLQVSGPTGAMTVVLLPVVAHYGVDKVPLLAIMAGLLVVVMGITGMGRTVDLIPWPVVEGFTFGIGIIIALQQIPLALDTPKGDSESTLVSSWQTLLATDWVKAIAPLGVVAGVVVIHLILQRFAKALPASLIAIVVATLVAQVAGLPVLRIGELPASLPVPSVPDWSWQLVTQLAGPAVAVAALAALESLLSARVADGFVPEVPRTNADRELFGQGLANIASGFFGGLPATGAIARTAVNARVGGRTRVAAITHALVLVVVIYALGPLVSLIPLSALAGVLIMTALRMINLGVAGRIWRTTRSDRVTFIATLVTTVVLDLITAVLLGVAMAAILSLRHLASTSAVRREYLPASTPDGLVDFPTHAMHDTVAIFRIDGALFYGDARRFIDTVSSVDDVRGVIVRAHRTRVLDASGSEALREVGETLRRRGIPMVVQGLAGPQLRIAIAAGAITPDRHSEDLPGAIDLMCDLLGAPAHAVVTGGSTEIFSYGSFTQTEVHRRVYGRRLIGQLDSLPGYRLRLIDVPEHQSEVLGITSQPAAMPGNPDDLVAGKRYRIEESELAAVDAINAPLFRREWLELASGKSAWVFVARDGVLHRNVDST
ncbi:sulfate permease, SulP family [Tessaracoccus bendigoensis DSM 12906]|uniref:Sulfate permease, SulP family n=1 Tax=Tessaracoccus bendigoensis DSM 12906 TaxID=1123357 RepID=A0A1M6LBB9_9ACTN|nr:solute carrier family 23 protein [Tessaracoccus bendigoensis]SHJ68452.1 sulfate permease, SulP family [Tessaracoccus bendigoensis DSM 12906]